MSDFLGADLVQLDELSAGYTDAGGKIKDDATLLVEDADRVVTAFRDEMKAFLAQVTTLAEGIEAESNTLETDGESVQWFGLNHGAFVGDLQVFGGHVRSGSALIVEDINRINSEIESKLLPKIEEMRAELDLEANAAEESTATMSTAVATQRDNLDQAANTGWTGS
ncbi:MAG: hypothetical protein AAGD35_07220 [Actinomycetota bacterium]